jgi:hypothetical protein
MATGTIVAIDRRMFVMTVYRPYHETGHVLNTASACFAAGFRHGRRLWIIF